MISNITVQVASEYKGKISEKLIINIAETARELGSGGLCLSSIAILLTNDQNLKNLHYRYLKENTVTDVLAFPYNEIWEQGKLIDKSPQKSLDDEYNHLGDIVVSYSQANKQAIMYGHKIQIELATLIAHGTLHLLGFDHFEDSQKILMKNKTLMILKEFNFSNKTL